MLDSRLSIDAAAAGRLEYRRRWRLFWFVFFAYLPLGALFMAWIPVDPMYFALPWMALFLVAGGRLGYFRCPACHEHAFVTSTWRNLLSRSCLHCDFVLRPRGRAPGSDTRA